LPVVGKKWIAANQQSWHAAIKPLIYPQATAGY
jgi:hypothetical protein